MGALDPRTPVDDLRRLDAELRELGRRLDLLEAPSGTQAFRTVAKLSAIVDDIRSQIDQWAATRWTNAQILAQIDAKIAAAFAGNVSITGSLTVSGAVTLPDVFNTDIAALGGSRKAVWVRDGGRMGNTA
ncbi:hypothetical protein GKD59_21810 [Parabacteroides distasonis]|uniref:Uncharacterized protein n=3 Tax=Pseudomonadati TaxID=3379134 RepID=A0A7K0GP62_PARDI|nr:MULTISPECIES: hypothetical protein [Bacteria]KAB5323597.1 hypothetical protein F9951_18280 [Bacteroides stercoris]MRY60487.1 hypothetical protein [Parabacteroides distasonis]MSA77486.1 hypothetical protein [Parabacteroides distasonis]MTU01741.1 hypothetical protein [Parasutterella excrementihominis]MTU24582.1 hypothetical protein [Parasutterella excrementihominis]